MSGLLGQEDSEGLHVCAAGRQTAQGSDRHTRIIAMSGKGYFAQCCCLVSNYDLTQQSVADLGLVLLCLLTLAASLGFLACAVRAPCRASCATT